MSINITKNCFNKKITIDDKIIVVGIVEY